MQELFRVRIKQYTALELLQKAFTLGAAVFPHLGDGDLGAASRAFYRRQKARGSRRGCHRDCPSHVNPLTQPFDPIRGMSSTHSCRRRVPPRSEQQNSMWRSVGKDQVLRSQREDIRTLQAVCQPPSPRWKDGEQS